jgi:hypothetical protein
VFSSWKPSKKLSKSSSALSILSAYSPIIQIIDALGNTAKTTMRYKNITSHTEKLDSCNFHWKVITSVLTDIFLDFLL